MSKTVGILGGMGPLATVDFFAKIVRNTPAAVDQDHLRIIIDNNPQIPPRVEAILEGAESPLPSMLESVRLLERAGAELIAMPCNTAHYWIKELQEAAKVPFINMVDTAVAHLARRQGGVSCPTLLLATGAAIRMGLYQKAFAEREMAVQTLAADEQQLLDAAVRQVKAGAVTDNPFLDRLNSIFRLYAVAGTQAVLAGCTEVPLLFPYFTGNMAKYDATAILAQTVVEMAQAE